jgi:hypothetical protein
VSVKVFISAFLVFTFTFKAQVSIRGLVTEKDSTTVLPFTYVIVKNTGAGTMSDHLGRFSIVAGANDTLLFSYTGFLKTYVPVKRLGAGNLSHVIITMIALPLELAPITITAFIIKPYERDYMNDIIEKSTLRRMDYATSPVTALYMRYSKEGKQIRKLSQIFEQLLIEEQVQKKLSREILVRLTQDESVDYQAFRKYCYYLSDYYIIHHDGVELYSKVMDCYRNYKNEGRDRPLRLRETQREQ